MCLDTQSYVCIPDELSQFLSKLGVTGSNTRENVNVEIIISMFTSYDRIKKGDV